MSSVNVIGWDIGGANVKAARLSYSNSALQGVRVASLPFAIWQAKEQLPEVLGKVLEMVGGNPRDVKTLTMTAELSDAFRTKREGVLFVLDCAQIAFPGSSIYGYAIDGRFVPLDEAKQAPTDFAATNWLASAVYISQKIPDCMLFDIGSTTTDIIPILDGRVQAKGKTDLERLLNGELVYTGVLRTHLTAIAHQVPVHRRLCPVSSEYFSISGDVHLLLEKISPEDYVCPTPDGRPATVEFARERLARLVCSDLEGLHPEEVQVIAQYLYQLQLDQIERAARQVLSRINHWEGCPMLALGIGAYMGVEVGEKIGLPAVDIEPIFGREGATVAPCMAVASLFADRWDSNR